MVHPRPELRRVAGSELHPNSSSYQQACRFLNFTEKTTATDYLRHLTPQKQSVKAIVLLDENLRFRGFLKDAVAVRALHHETPAQALPSHSRVVEVGK